MMVITLIEYRHQFERLLKENGGGMLQIRRKGRTELKIMRKERSEELDKASDGGVGSMSESFRKKVRP